MKKTIVVTGAAGFIGSHLCDVLLAQHFKVVAIDNLSMGKRENLFRCLKNKDFLFHKIDVTNRKDMMSVGCHFQTIVHLAAYKIPRYGNAIETAKTNTLGAFNALELARRAGAKAVLASTSDVYGKNPNVPFHEESDSVLGPSTVQRWTYAASKLFTEHLAFAHQNAFGFPVSIARFFGSYGPRQHPSWWGGPQAVFINAVLRGQEIEIHGDGMQTRSFCYISDTIDGLIRLIKNDKANGGIFNIGSVQEITILDLARLIKRISGVPGKFKIKFVPYKNFGKYEDVRRRVPNIIKARTLLNFRPKMSLRDGLKKTIEWQKTELGL